MIASLIRAGRVGRATGLLVAVLGVGLAGCAGTAGRVAEAEPSLPEGDSTSDVATEPGEEQFRYIIGTGDQLSIFVWRHEELSGQVSVRPDGRISTPLVQDISAAGKTPMDLARDIEKHLEEYVRSPSVTVIVERFEGDASQRIRIIGAAQQPQALPFFGGMTVMDAMISVGGLSEFASGNRAKVVRRGADGDRVEIPVRIADLLEDGDLEQDVVLEPGDVIVIPDSIL